MTTPSPLVALALLWLPTACAPYGRYRDGAPPEGAPTGHRIAPERVTLSSSGSSAAQWSNPPRQGGAPCGHGEVAVSPGETQLTVLPCPDFAVRPDLLAPALPPPAAAASFVGELRTADVALPGPAYLQIACGWSGFELGPRISADACRTVEAAAVVEGLLDELRAQAGRLGADRVTDVGCFGAADRAAPRLWCEGRAWLTVPLAP